MASISISWVTSLGLVSALACGCSGDDSNASNGSGGQSAGGQSPSSGGSNALGGRSSSGGAPTGGGSPIGGGAAGAATAGGSAIGGGGGIAGKASAGGATYGGVAGTAGRSAAGGAVNGGSGGAAGRSAAGSTAIGGGAAGRSAAGSTAIGGGGVAGKASAGASAVAGSKSELPTVGNCTVFPADNPWNTDISAYPVRADSAAFINSIGASGHLHPDFGTVWDGAPIGIPYVVVPGSQPKVPIEFTDYGDESDEGPYPIPPDAPIEGGPSSDGDRHVLVIDSGACVLYELGNAYPVSAGASWQAGAGAIWDLKVNATRPLGWTSVDAAGLPIFPGLARYDEIVEKKALNHALRFTVSQTQRAYVAPASHYASSSTDATRPPMGLRLRMKAGFDCAAYSEEVRTICAGLKRFGMIVADNGSNWYISGAPDSRWSDDNLADLGQIPGSAFEVVDTGTIHTSY
jgi:hypothetical protein